MGSFTIDRLLVFTTIVMLAITLVPTQTTEAVESNHVTTSLPDGAETEVRFNPNALQDFEIIFSTQTRDFDITMNFSGVDSGGAYDTANWEVTFDPAEFTVGYSNDVTVTISISTNLTTNEKGRYLDLSVWGDVADDDRDDIDTNAQTYRLIIAERDDVQLSVNTEDERRSVFPRSETRFNVHVTNIGWDVSTISITARIVDDSAIGEDPWIVRVIYASLENMESGETRIGFINVSSPQMKEAGDYRLEITAHVGAIGSARINVTARVEMPDFSVKSITPLYNPVLEGVEVTFTVVIENKGGYGEDVEVRGEVKGHDDKWENLLPATIPEITNYNESATTLKWTALMNVRDDFQETWTIRITVDYLSSIEESNEGNNQGEGSIIVREIEKASVSFNTQPALVILGVMVVFIASVALNRRKE